MTKLDRGNQRSHVLYCGLEAIPKADNVTVLRCDDSPPDFQVPNLYPSQHADRSEQIRHALERLHREHRFDRIEFGTLGGLGFRTIQAKRAGLAFGDVSLTVRLDGCGPWQRQQAGRWPNGYEEVAVDFAERFSFENADSPISTSPELLDFVRSLGWVSRDAEALRSGARSPLVTIGIAHYNLGRYLPETLASLAAQTYPNLEVLVIDDGSTDPIAIRIFSEMETLYPPYRFLRQENAGIGATRNCCLSLAQGEYFIPVDADNIARPEMVARFVEAIERNPDLDALTCYFLAFEDGIGNPPKQFLHAYRPTGGPHVLASIRNVYGDANAIFRTASFRAIGGYETDRGTSCEDWEAFVKMVHAGQRIGVVPEHLFYYRHLAAGFSRRTDQMANHRRVLRQFTQLVGLPPGEGEVLWTALIGSHQRLQQLESERTLLRYRIADAVFAPFARMPWVTRVVKKLMGARRASKERL